ncbi:MAG: preprotein translocase subunit YajC [Oscillospiraceae bacterium]|jgi:preprotein translocase subunit YajC|nr:preprotein translocase subunit YajC [Oscillospiraceae bacterium]
MAANDSGVANQAVQAAPPQGEPAGKVAPSSLFGGPNGVLLLTLLFCLVFFWFSGKSRKKREQEESAIRKNVEVGDELTTIGGIVGIVVGVRDDVFTLETGSDRSKLRIEKWAIKSNITAAARMAKRKEIEKSERKGGSVK